jgi:hypothetical protein
LDKDTINLIITGISALFTGLAALFSLLAVRNASKSNKLATEQYKETMKLNKQNNRPVLDIATKTFKVDFIESLIVDWDQGNEELYLPKYASNSFIQINNIGNKTARNVQVIFYYENLDLVNKNIKEVDKYFYKSHIYGSSSIKIKLIEKYEKDRSYNEYILTDERGNISVKKQVLNDVSYAERYGSIYPSGENNSSSVKIYLPKLFVYLNNILANSIMDEKIKIPLIIKLSYTDAYNNHYIQRFRIENFIRRLTDGGNGHMISQLIPEEIENELFEANAEKS